MKSMKRKGFTLVELLIVIVVIGILSSMMMMSSTEATTSARASNIVSNLRNLKTAALAYYTDHLDAITANPAVDISGIKSHDAIFAYLGATNIPDSGDYHFANSNGNWYVSYDIDGAKGLSGSEKSGIKTKLAGRAKSVGLCKNVASMDPFVNTDPAVAMFIR